MHSIQQFASFNLYIHDSSLTYDQQNCTDSVMGCQGLFKTNPSVTSHTTVCVCGGGGRRQPKAF